MSQEIESAAGLEGGLNTKRWHTENQIAWGINGHLFVDGYDR